jgi:hypothetical protein
MGCIYSKSSCIPADSPKVHFPKPLTTIINNDNTIYNIEPLSFEQS